MGFKETVSGAVSAVWETISTVFSAIWEFISGVATNIWTSITTAFTNILSGITGTIGNIKDSIVTGFTAAIDWIKALPAQAVQWGKDIIHCFLAVKGQRTVLFFCIFLTGFSIDTAFAVGAPTTAQNSVVFIFLLIYRFFDPIVAQLLLSGFLCLEESCMSNMARRDLIERKPERLAVWR
mgnify:CR=1 FL=1